VKPAIRSYLVLLVGAGLLILFDQGSKVWLRTHLPEGETWMPWAWLAPLIQIVHTRNTGAAFSLGRGFSPVFMVAAIAVSLGILYYYPRIASQGWLMRLAVIFILAGALGNLIDRLAFGEVTDFIFINHFAVINVADICINVGVGFMLVHLLWKRPPAEPSQTGEE
jgi:signal peptidase II